MIFRGNLRIVLLEKFKIILYNESNIKRMRLPASLIRFMEDITLYLNVVELQYLASIDDKITQSRFGSEKFADNNTNKTEADVDLHIADDIWDTSRNDDFLQDIFFIAAKGANKQEFIRIHLIKMRGQVNNSAKNSQ